VLPKNAPDLILTDISGRHSAIRFPFHCEYPFGGA
jgi:hypothetical protein